MYFFCCHTPNCCHLLNSKQHITRYQLVTIVTKWSRNSWIFKIKLDHTFDGFTQNHMLPFHTFAKTQNQRIEYYPKTY